MNFYLNDCRCCGWLWNRADSSLLPHYSSRRKCCDWLGLFRCRDQVDFDGLVAVGVKANGDELMAEMSLKMVRKWPFNWLYGHWELERWRGEEGGGILADGYESDKAEALECITINHEKFPSEYSAVIAMMLMLTLSMCLALWPANTGTCTPTPSSLELSSRLSITWMWWWF